MKSMLKGLRGEFKKIVWPNPKQLINKTITVLVVVAICAVIVSLLDTAFVAGVKEFSQFISGK